MEEKHSEQIGQLSDRIDNLIHALDLPMTPQFHIEQIKNTLPELRDELRAVYHEATGNNPWEY